MTSSGGVRAGGRAVVRDPARVVVVSCPDADAEGFGRLVALVTGFCPAVESVRLGVCAFAARGPARYFGLLTAVQVADRVRWQLDQGGPGAASDNSKTDNSKSRAGGGGVALRLIPDQLVRDTGRQLALWGEAVVTDKVARAAMRVQALLGHDAVLRPVPAGGRTVRDQLQLLPFGENLTPKLATDRPWPGRIPGPSPAVVFEKPKAATVTDPGGAPVTVSGRCAVSGPPAILTVDGEPARTITGWAGPWPLAERWWDPSQATRIARFQLVTDDGRAWLAAVRDGGWQVEAGYW